MYVHVPFCRRACSYCDFYFVVTEKQKSRYVAAVEREMRANGGGAAASLYFGGGTPSRLEAEQIHRLISAAKSAFDFSSEAEITLEANPEDVRDPATWKAAGINRVSLGVQSL
ncbi:MAG: radical SAM protein, partial [Bacteroidia bacterium]|nr:radical SAM protein [Bacteroidia bacterium]